MLFRRNYKVRRYGEQHFINGHAVQDYTDSCANIDIQPDGDSLNAPAEGATTVTRLSGWSAVPFTAANQKRGVKGDRVFWHCNWYECTSCVNWDGTPLWHFKSTFTICPPEVNRNDD